MLNIVTAKEIGQILKRSESTIYKLSMKGEIPGFKIGDSWRFDMDEVLKVMRNKKQERGERRKNDWIAYLNRWLAHYHICYFIGCFSRGVGK